MAEKRQFYNEEFKRETVKFVQAQTKTLPDIAEDLNIPEGTLRQWLGKYRVLENEPVASGETIRQQTQLLQQQDREIADLKEEIAILKKAMHIFSKERN
jgi:transposase